MKREIREAGDRGLLVDLGDVSAEALHAAADGVRRLSGVMAVVPGQQSLFVMFDRDPRLQDVESAIASSRPVAMTGSVHEISVSFDPSHALDLELLLQRAGLTRSRFLDQVADVSLTARYLGFRAGFAYLDGWPHSWSLPRRTTSRNLVPRGSFAIAGTIAGFYPIDTPGGWNVLGLTGAALWDMERDPPNLIAPGDRVKIQPTKEDFASVGSPSSGILTGRGAETSQPQPLLSGATVAVLAPGQLTLVVGGRDWSRMRFGLPAGGPFDAGAMALANDAVGNDSLAPALECVLVGPRLRFDQTRSVAWCDGEGAVEVRLVRAGEVYEVGRLRGGFRGYLAVEGGFHDPRPRFAEAPVQLRAGHTLRAQPGQHPSGGKLAIDEKNASRHAGRLRIRIVAGPHDAPSLPQEWIVTTQMNRIGIRLAPTVEITIPPPANLPSCGMQFGTLQWHPDGSLMAMGPDHPVTGGYLQPATVVSEDLWKLGQLAPGERVQLVAE